jgi:hypothetical protein
MGAALLAMWATVRFPKLAPQRPAFVLLHLLIASVAAQSGVGMGMQYIARADLSPLLPIFVVALPALVYVFLVAMWVIMLAQRLLSGSGPRGGLTTRV